MVFYTYIYGVNESDDLLARQDQWVLCSIMLRSQQSDYPTIPKSAPIVLILKSDLDVSKCSDLKIETVALTRPIVRYSEPIILLDNCKSIICLVLRPIVRSDVRKNVVRISCDNRKSRS